MASSSRANGRSASSSGDESEAGSSVAVIQDARERRVLRSNYRKIINDLQGGSDEEDEAEGMEVSVDQTKLQETIERVENLFIKVNHPREAALDSQVYSMIARSAKNAVQTVKTNILQFEPQEFAEKMQTHFGVDRSDPCNFFSDQNWTDLCKGTVHVFNRTPAYHFFCGSFDPGVVLPKPVAPRRPRATANAGESSQARPTLVQEVRQNDNQFGEKTSEQVENVYQTLLTLYEKNHDNALCFFKFSCHPTSFSQTIENIFHISFLVKDGFVRVFYDEYGLPVIEPVEKEENSQKGGDKKALAMGMSVAEWEDIIRVFNITGAAISRNT